MSRAKSRVLVTDGQLRSALAVVRSLGRRDIEVVCGETTRFATAAFSRYVDGRVVYPSPESKPEEFVESIRETVLSRGVDVVFPVGHETTELLSKHRDEFSGHARIPVAEYPKFERGWDKAKTIRAAKRAGVPHPETACPTSLSEAKEVAKQIGYPVVIKARTSSGSRGLKFVRSKDAFEEKYDAVDAEYPRPLVQERIDQDGRMYGAAFLYSEDGEVLAQFACEFLREYPPSGGPSTLHRSIDRPDVLEHGRRLLDELNWEGIALVEFKEDPESGIPQLMEVNPRFWSSLHLPMFAGIDFPWLVWQYANGNEIPQATTYRTGVYARYLLPGDFLHLASVRSEKAVREFFPLVDKRVNYEIPSWDDKGPTIGRLAAMARFAASKKAWQKVIFR